MTDSPETHPRPDRLAALRLGHLDEAEATYLRRHLAECPACRKLANIPPPAAPTGPGAHDAVTVPPREAAEMPSAVPPELAGHSRYRIVELLGRGGMGQVYKAEHQLMERVVALKVISHSLTDNAAMVERFRREVKAAARLTHPNIVTAYDAEQSGDSHFLVMEFVDGISLDRLLAREGPLPVARACEYARQAALGLQHAFECGMVHRDIKPQNLMLTPQGQIKVLDFGLARFAMENLPAGAFTQEPGDGRTSESLTQVGTVMGTPDYIAPEQARDAHAADIRADIYSLGCTLYDLLAGQPPFPEGTAVQKVLAHAERAPRPLTELRKNVPPRLARVVARMMAKEPAQRYPTPADVAEALRPFTRECSGRLRRVLRRVAVLGLLVLLLSAGAYIAYAWTDYGEVLLEADADWAEALFQQSGLEVRDWHTGQQYLLKPGRHRLPAGEYGVNIHDKAFWSAHAPRGCVITFVPLAPDDPSKSTLGCQIRRGQTTTVKVQARLPDDQARMQGTWVAVEAETDGIKIPEAMVRRIAFTFTFTGDTARLAAKDPNIVGPLGKDVRFYIDPTKNPKTIDFIAPGDKENTLFGIYRFENDLLRICGYLEPSGFDRPTEFATKPRKKMQLLLLRRVPDVDKARDPPSQ
jgi:uncharacterized protein (TIGR03067 family)